MREVTRNVVTCAMCETAVELAAMDSPHTEAPTLFQPSHPDVQAPWFGFVSDGTLLVVCSDACAQKFLEE